MDLWVFLGLTLCYTTRINGLSITVTRGYQDFTSMDGLKCEGSDTCKCEHGSTFMFDGYKGRCVRDYEIIKDDSGKFLPRNNKCIGVTDDERLVNMSCNEHDLSVKWIWTLHHGQMLNLKTLKCLKGESTKIRRRKFDTTFSVEQCDSNVLKQQWECKRRPRRRKLLKNKGAMGFELNWLVPGNDSYFQNCTENIYSYKGCYRFADGKFIKLIENTRCDTWENGTCGLHMKIQAPLGARYNSQSCQLNWRESRHTISGYWQPFTEALHEVQLNTTVDSVTLQIQNKTSLLSKWKGHLLRLNIKCYNNEGRSESHCALLKIEGTATEQIVKVLEISPNVSSSPTPTTSYNSSRSMSGTTSENTSQFTTATTSGVQNKKTSTTISTKTTSYLRKTSGSDKENQDGSDNEKTSLVIPLLTAAVVLLCLLLAGVAIAIICKRRNRKKGDVNQNDEHVYEEATPPDNGPVSPIYMEIDYLGKKKNSSKKSNGGKKRNKSHSYDEATENPFYHTLEKPNRVEDDGIYEELDEIAATVEIAKTVEIANTVEIAKTAEIATPVEIANTVQMAKTVVAPKPFEKELDV